MVLSYLRRSEMDLKNALYKAGLVNSEKLRKEEGLARVRDEIPLARMRKRHSDIEQALETLSKTTTPMEFRREARKVLRNNPIPALLQAVITLFHKKELWKQEGGKRLRSNLFNMKSHFGSTPKSLWNEVLDLELPDK